MQALRRMERLFVGYLKATQLYMFDEAIDLKEKWMLS